MKLITVIVPAYNSQNYIERCLRSLEGQTMDRGSYDIIVINDGSTDNTASIIKSKFNKVILENRKTNKGVPFAINRGIGMANTRFIVRVDSDDYVHEKFLELLQLTINMNHECDAIACDYFEVDENEEHLKQFDCLDDPIACGILFKHSTLIKLGLYDDRMMAREEEDLMMRFNENKHKLIRLPLPLYRYRRHANNRTKDKKLADEYARVFQAQNSIYEVLKTLIWFLRKGPKFYATMVALLFRKLRTVRDSSEMIEIEKKWCEENLVSYEECLSKLGFRFSKKEVFSPDHVKEVKRKLKISESNFGGQGHIFLLYDVCENLEAMKALETGVAYGWSSAAILSSVSKRSGKLISVDMPMVKQTDYHLIGVAVNEDLKGNWELLREPDKHGLNRAIKKHNYSYDLAHYDSDKSYYGRKWSQPLIWKYLRKGGIFISDDIEDNSAFREFVVSNNLDFSVLKFEGKYVGVIKKDT